MGIGAAEHKRKSDTIVTASEGGGVPAQKQAVIFCTAEGAAELHLKNLGDEDIEYELLARGKTVPVAGENIAALQVGATSQFQGLLANREVTPGTFSATDAGVPQTVQDDGHGNIVDAAAPATIVGTIDYERGYIDFVWPAAFVGAGVTADYDHRGWQSFATPILGTIVAGGGEDDVIFRKAAGADPADNFADGIKGNKYLGLLAISNGLGSRFSAELVHYGPDTDQKLVPTPRFRKLNEPQPLGW